MLTAVPTTGENAALFANLISRTAQDIDILIESLPSQEYTPEKQVNSTHNITVTNTSTLNVYTRAIYLYQEHIDASAECIYVLTIMMIIS